MNTVLGSHTAQCPLLGRSSGNLAHTARYAQIARYVPRLTALVLTIFAIPVVKLVACGRPSQACRSRSSCKTCTRSMYSGREASFETATEPVSWQNLVQNVAQGPCCRLALLLSRPDPNGLDIFPSFDDICYGVFATLKHTLGSLADDESAAFQRPIQPPVQQADFDWEEPSQMTPSGQTGVQSPAQQEDNNGQGPTQRLPYRQPRNPVSLQCMCNGRQDCTARYAVFQLSFLVHSHIISEKCW